jgi:hypothetical protein
VTELHGTCDTGTGHSAFSDRRHNHAARCIGSHHMNMNVMSRRSQKHSVERACGLELFANRGMDHIATETSQLNAQKTSSKKTSSTEDK